MGTGFDNMMESIGNIGKGSFFGVGVERRGGNQGEVNGT